MSFYGETEKQTAMEAHAHLGYGTETETKTKERKRMRPRPDRTDPRPVDCCRRAAGHTGTRPGYMDAAGRGRDEAREETR